MTPGGRVVDIHTGEELSRRAELRKRVLKFDDGGSGDVVEGHVVTLLYVSKATGRTRRQPFTGESVRGRHYSLPEIQAALEQKMRGEPHAIAHRTTVWRWWKALKGLVKALARAVSEMTNLETGIVMAGLEAHLSSKPLRGRWLLHLLQIAFCHTEFVFFSLSLSILGFCVNFATKCRKGCATLHATDETAAFWRSVTAPARVSDEGG